MQPPMVGTVLQVALGGAIGAVLRFGAGQAALRWAGAGFPWGTLAVNVIGSFLMGCAFVALADGKGAAAPFLMTGVLGGFTTFSAFSLDAVALFERGDIGAAAIYVVASVALSIAALIAGIAFARGVLI